MVFYLKYRPRKISDLDSEALRQRLEKVLKGNLVDNIPHAFLFTGPKGLGKTSTARIIAKSINCINRKPQEFEPCNKCSSCKSIDNSSNLDILEIDGASNRGIDEIRDLREKIRLSPVSSIKKIYIIDEVHMLTAEAFNALLKTLEEPPAHAVFVMCTTEPQKIPETISSRCFHIRFTRATDEELINSFKRILKSEGIKADDKVLKEIAQLSDGSFRDGVKILEELSIETKIIKEEDVENKYNLKAISKNTIELINSLEKKDVENGIKILEELAIQGTDFKIFIEYLINELHKKLLNQIKDGTTKEIMNTKTCINEIVKAYTNLRYSVLPQLPLEIAVIDICSTDNISINESTIEDTVTESKNLNPSTQVNVLETKTITEKSDKTSYILASGNDKILEELINKVKKVNFSIAGFLRSCTVEKYTKNELILSTEYRFHKEKLSDKKVLDVLEKSMKELNGKEIKVSIVLKG